MTDRETEARDLWRKCMAAKKPTVVLEAALASVRAQMQAQIEAAERMIATALGERDIARAALERARAALRHTIAFIEAEARAAKLVIEAEAQDDPLADMRQQRDQLSETCGRLTADLYGMQDGALLRDTQAALDRKTTELMALKLTGATEANLRARAEKAEAALERARAVLLEVVNSYVEHEFERGVIISEDTIANCRAVLKSPLCK